MDTPPLTSICWIPCKWRIAGTVDRVNEICIVSVARALGPDRFVIRCGCEVMNRDGVWEAEPSPSDRDAGFLARTRFADFAEAAEVCRRHQS